MKMEKETCWNYPRDEEGGIKENDGRGEDSATMCCKNFCKYHSVSPEQQ
jgi:hypothetical protein